MNESSECEVQAVREAYDLAACLQSRVSDAQATCDPWMDDFKRLTEEVADGSAARIAVGNARHYSVAGTSLFV